MRTSLLLSLLLGFAWIGCDNGDSDKKPAEDTIEAEDTIGAEDTPEGLLPFGGECAADGECESGLCHEFGEGIWCTLACEEATDCPEGSEGQKCNKQMVCRP